MNIMFVLAGILIVFFGFGILVGNLPAMHNVTGNTGAGTMWENSSATTKNAVSFFDNIVLVSPFLFFALGLGAILKGITGG